METNPVQETRPKSILFVDDDKFLLDMYALKFTKNNFEVKTAEGSETALKLIRDGFKPDILLVDVVMPGMDGIELVSTLKRDDLLKNTIVIMLTNQGLPDDIARAKKLNVDGYIIKATTIPSEVLAEVNKIANSIKSKNI